MRRVPFAWLLLLNFITAACSKSGSQDGGSVTAGSINLALSAGGTEIEGIDYKITGNGLNKEGTIPVTGNGSLYSALISGIPAGQGYTITLTASGEGAAFQCSGSATLNITAGQTTSVSVRLQCPGSHKAGSVLVTGDINLCAVADAAGAASTNLAVGVPVTLTGVGNDDDAMPAPISYAWEVTGGAATLQGATQATAQLTCTAPGAITVKLTVSDGDCGDSTTLDLSCAEAGPTAGSGGSSAAGSAAGGSSAGQGGAGGTAAAGSGGSGSIETTCSKLAHACHNVDPGSGPIHDCHLAGHANDEAACVAQLASCTQACGAALCTKLASTCHDVDPGSGALHECHELGHEGDAQACFDDGPACYTACVAAGGAGGSGGAGGNGGSTGAAGSGGGTTPVTIHFKAKVGSLDFACGQTYAGVGTPAVSVTPADFRLLVQDLQLITAGGTSVPVTLDVRAPWQASSVALLDFENGAGACAGEGNPETNTTITGSVPAGDYVGISFVNGVPDALNHGDPTTAPDPLKTYASLSWGWLSGFRFVKAELVQTDAAQGAIPGSALAHVGSTSCSGNPQQGTVTCAKPNRNKVVLSGFDPDSNTVVADLGAIFASSDVSVDTSCHGSGTECPPMFSALGVNYANGQPAATQSVYHVE